MAWPTIGSLDFISFSGRVSPIAQRSEDITRKNVDGIEFRTLGKRANPTTHTTFRDVEDAATAKTLEDSYRALRSTLQTVTYRDGESRENVMVKDVNIISVERKRRPVGGIVGGEYMVQAEWELQATE